MKCHHLIMALMVSIVPLIAMEKKHRLLIKEITSLYRDDSFTKYLVQQYIGKSAYLKTVDSDDEEEEQVRKGLYEKHKLVTCTNLAIKLSVETNYPLAIRTALLETELPYYSKEQIIDRYELLTPYGMLAAYLQTKELKVGKYIDDFTKVIAIDDAKVKLLSVFDDQYWDKIEEEMAGNPLIKKH